MSANSLARLAVERDLAPPGQSIKTSTEVLIAAIPSETLAAYTTLVGVVLAGDVGQRYSQFRWAAYGAFVLLAFLAPLVNFRRSLMMTRDMEHRALPIQECFAATVAAAAWGLVMPGSPLSISIRGNALVFATTGIVVAAATLLAFATQVLGTANGKNQHAPGRATSQPANGTRARTPVTTG